jgi:hypothetical protein
MLAAWQRNDSRAVALVVAVQQWLRRNMQPATDVYATKW